MAQNFSHLMATGRRKTSVAQVRLVPGGSGRVTINSKPADEYFKGKERHQFELFRPISLVEAAQKYDFVLKILGGGQTGQAEAGRLAIAKVLVTLDEKNRKAMRAHGFLTRDPRMVERKKSGQPKARKRFQYSKR